MAHLHCIRFAMGLVGAVLAVQMAFITALVRRYNRRAGIRCDRRTTFVDWALPVGMALISSRELLDPWWTHIGEGVRILLTPGVLFLGYFVANMHRWSAFKQSDGGTNGQG